MAEFITNDKDAIYLLEDFCKLDSFGWRGERIRILTKEKYGVQEKFFNSYDEIEQYCKTTIISIAYWIFNEYKGVSRERLQDECHSTNKAFRKWASDYYQFRVNPQCLEDVTRSTLAVHHKSLENKRRSQKEDYLNKVEESTNKTAAIFGIFLMVPFAVLIGLYVFRWIHS